MSEAKKQSVPSVPPDCAPVHEGINNKYAPRFDATAHCFPLENEASQRGEQREETQPNLETSLQKGTIED